MVGLSLHHEALATEPVENVSVGLSLAGTAYPAARRLELERLEGKVRDITARLSGSVALPTGTFKFANGRKLDVIPQIALAFTVPKMPCAKLLTSIPPALVPHLQGFELKGTFTADVGAKIDFADLDALALTGKVGIDGCKVVKAPPEVLALDGKQPGKQSLVVNVEVPRKFGAEAPRKSAAPGDHRTRRDVGRDRAGQPRLRSLRRDLAVPGQVDHDHRGQRVLQAPRLGHAREFPAALQQEPGSAAASGWARRRSRCRW